MPCPKRLIDRIADASVLLPTLLGALFVGQPDYWGGFAICAGVTCALHVWFRAEDRWRHRRLLRAARTSRLGLARAMGR